MKALICGVCADIRALKTEWVSCGCGITRARWVDPHRGTAEFLDPGKDRRRFCMLLGLNNQLLGPALRGELAMFQDFREAHDHATDAPGYVFDKSKGACWAVIVAVGATHDVTWHKPEEEADVGRTT